MKHLVLFTLLCLVTVMAHAGTFELSDPAAEIMEEENEAEREKQANADTGDMPDYVNNPARDWKTDGIGNVVCSDHLSYRNSSSDQYGVNQNWLQGFIDGVAYQRFVTLGDHRLEPVYEPEEMQEWIANYCKKNQPDSLFDAIRAYLKDLTE